MSSDDDDDSDFTRGGDGEDGGEGGGGEGEGEDGGKGELGFPHVPITQQMMEKGLGILAKVRVFMDSHFVFRPVFVIFPFQ